MKRLFFIFVFIGLVGAAVYFGINKKDTGMNDEVAIKIYNEYSNAMIKKDVPKIIELTSHFNAGERTKKIYVDFFQNNEVEYKFEMAKPKMIDDKLIIPYSLVVKILKGDINSHKLKCEMIFKEFDGKLKMVENRSLTVQYIN